MMRLLDVILEEGFRLPSSHERIQSMTQVRDTVVIVTDFSVYQAKAADDPLKFTVQRLTELY